MHDVLLLLPLVGLLFKDKIVERFENEKCDVTERKISLLEEKMKLEAKKTISLPTKELNEKISEIDEKIKELDRQISINSENILKYSETYSKDKKNEIYKKEQELEEKKILEEKLLEEKELEEKNTYSFFNKINNYISDNSIFNAVIISLIIFLIMVVFYLFITNLFTYGKKRKIKLDKINIKYDNVLDEIKKSKVKKSIKVKKGKLFSFLDEKK